MCLLEELVLGGERGQEGAGEVLLEVVPLAVPQSLTEAEPEGVIRAPIPCTMDVPSMFSTSLMASTM